MTKNRRVLFGSNWKMNKTVRQAVEYVEALLRLMKEIPGIEERAQVFLIPPFTAIEAVRKASVGKFWVGAQNMHWEDWGPYTGEISAPMLCELGADLVELGHADRRRHDNETDSAINRKVLSALRHRLRPLLCIGESEAERKSAAAEKTVARQIQIALQRVDARSAEMLVIAYEPLWAIGQDGAMAGPDHVRRMSKHIRSVLQDQFGIELASRIPIIYGGDVNEKKAPEILLEAEIQGLFVGRAALQVENFARLMETCLEAVSTDIGK